MYPNALAHAKSRTSGRKVRLRGQLMSRLSARRTLAVRAAGPIMSKRRERGGVRARLVQDVRETPPRSRRFDM